MTAPKQLKQRYYYIFWSIATLSVVIGQIYVATGYRSLAQGVKYYTDALSISAYETVKMRRQEDWQDILDSWMDDPQSAANHLVLGMDLEQRRQARGKDGRSKTPTWV